ncbi:hypothetical protein BJ742DRAFT_768253 [Cladochytrium replicatum]|nr:hypothetical protein BJ742DRAFT_768253 [Cladochytrium replicatum]
MRDRSYDGHAVIRFYPSTSDHTHILLDATNNEPDLDPWSPLHTTTNPVDIHFPKHSSVLQILRSETPSWHPILSIPFTILVPNIRTLIGARKPLHHRADVDFFDDYHDPDTITTYMRGLIGAKEVVIGKTYQGRNISAFAFGKGSEKLGAQTVLSKRLLEGLGGKVVIVLGGLHAREWISPVLRWFFVLVQAVVTYLATNIQTGSGFSNLAFVFVPVVNVDGYVYTRSTDRLWRKTIEPVGSSCFGTDINRNFDVDWDSNDNNVGPSLEPCSEVFRGNKTFSTSEARAVRDLLLAIPEPSRTMVVDFHSYSQLVLYSPAFTCDDLSASSSNTTIALGARAFLRGVSIVNASREYRSGEVCKTLYGAKGSSLDYSYYVANYDYAYAIELPDQGREGFLLQPGQIKPVSNETLAGFLALLRFVQSTPSDHAGAAAARARLSIVSSGGSRKSFSLESGKLSAS